MNSQDGQYDYSRPWQSNEERLTTDALQRATLDSPRPKPQVKPLVPPRFGYRTDALGIDDVLSGLKEPAYTPRNFEGSVSGYQGTAFPSLQMF